MSTWSLVSSGYEHIPQLMQPWHFIAFAFSIAVCLRTFSSTRSSLQVAQTTYTVFFHTKTFLQHPNPPHPPCCRQVCLEGWCDSGRSCSSHYGRLTRSHFSQSENVRSATAVYLVRGSLIFASNKMSHSKIIHLLLPVLQGDNWLVAPPAYFRLLFWETIDAKRSSSYL